MKNFIKQPKKQQSGFTLIELLVVISIIGLLSSITLVALVSARQKARMVKRVADLAQVAKALELYYNDNNSYPDTGWGGIAPWWRSECAWTGNEYMQGNVQQSQVVWDETLNQGLVPKYMAKMASDPLMDKANTQRCFIYASNGYDYKLSDWGLNLDATLEQINKYPTFKDPVRNDFSPAICSPPGDPALALAVWSSGATCW